MSAMGLEILISFWQPGCFSGARSITDGQTIADSSFRRDEHGPEALASAGAFIVCEGSFSTSESE
jgi:hypothetical protein